MFVDPPASPPLRLLFNQRQRDVRGVRVNLNVFILKSPQPSPAREVGDSQQREDQKANEENPREPYQLCITVASPPRRLRRSWPPAAAIDWLMPPAVRRAAGLVTRDIGFSFFLFFFPPSPAPAAPAPFMVCISRGSSAACAYLPLGSG